MTHRAAIRASAAPGTDFLTEACELKVAAITPFTTIDYPGALAAVVFVQGCPWQCRYCQNDWMQSRAFAGGLRHESWQAVTQLLARRRGLLDAVVFSGGEPTMDPALAAAVREVGVRFGMQVGLHTGGAYPRRLKAVLPGVSWVGLDVKAPPANPALYDAVTGRPGSGAAFLQSFEEVLASGVAFEARTTAHPEHLTPEAILETAEWLAARGVTNYALQIYRRPPQKLFALPAVGTDYPGKAVEAELAALFPNFRLRRDQ